MSEADNPPSGGDQPHETPAESADFRRLGQQACDAARQTCEDLCEHATEYYEAGQEKVCQWERNLKNYVQENPLTALLIAAGAGFVLGAIWKRR